MWQGHGFGRFLSRWFPINQVWLELALTAVDLLAWTQSMLVDREPTGCPCATGCSTSQPDSPADNAAATSASPNTGAGPGQLVAAFSPASTSRPGRRLANPRHTP